MTEDTAKWTRNKKDMKQITNSDQIIQNEGLNYTDDIRISYYNSKNSKHSKELIDQNSLYQCKMRKTLRWKHFRLQHLDNPVNKFKISDFLSVTKNRVSNLYRLVYLCVIFNVICSDKLIISVNCDELIDSVGVEGHYTPTWAVHIPDGDNVAYQVAKDHEMELVGKVSILKVTSYS